MAFDNVRFPVSISRGLTGGPERRTDVVMTASGQEERNARWANSRRRYNAGYGVKSLDDIHAVISFFEERRGRLYAFRFKDHADFKSCKPSQAVGATDQVIGTGDGVTTAFQLVKAYGSTRSYVRVITAPVAGTVLASVNGVATAAFSVDATTGLITFATPPAAGAVIAAGFEFDVPVRFDTDQIRINLAHFAGGDIPDIPLIEVRP
ncbi:MAG: DUF2460 domain-containing protein [Alphaproteobacteria bacterium]|nr:DUF2460 domain-containing protein [Alphaproteobacteria bacterium]